LAKLDKIDRGRIMPPKILPTEGLPYTGAGAEAEQKTVNFLKALPDHYFVLRELRMLPSLEKRRVGSSEDRIDSVIIGPDIGVLILEIKDWNIYRNTYEWLNQYEVCKTDDRGNVVKIRNPYAQLSEYVNAVREHLTSQLGTYTVYVHGFVVFPKLSRAEFENRFLRPDSRHIRNPQESFLVNVEQTLFGDKLDHYLDNPLSLLKQLVKLHISRPYDDKAIIKTVNALIPPKLPVGDLSRLDRGYEELLLQKLQA
jgi:Nuclease-related domain